MSSPLPERPPIHAAPAAGQAEPTDDDRETVRRLFAALDEIPTRYLDETPVPLIGSAPPVAQPGIPPMSQRASDISRLMLYGGAATVPPGLIAIGLLIASENANPTVIAWICAAPAALAVPILTLARLLRRAKDAAPDEIHNHYEGPVYQDQREVHTSTRGVWAKTNNNP